MAHLNLQDVSLVSLAAALAAVLAGCSGAGSADSFARNCQGVTDVAVPGPGSADGHGAPARHDGDVEVMADGAEFRARQVVTIVNDFGGAANSDVTFSTQNGAVVSCPDGRGGYGIRAELEAYGATEEEARQSLAAIVVNHADALADGTLQLDTTVEFRAVEGAPEPVPLPDVGGDRRRATLKALLPAGVRHAFHHSTANGDVQAMGFSGSAADLSASNGSVFLAGAFDDAALDTSNGLVYAAGDFAALTAGATNGAITAALETRRSTQASLGATNGTVDVTLAVSGSPGFDLTAQTTNGRALIRVRGAQPVGEQQPDSAHHRTPDYDSRAVQVAIDAGNTNGDVSIHE